MTRNGSTRRGKDRYTGPQRCAIYIRVSDPKQEREGTSLQTQEATCRQFALERGYVVVAIHSDVHTGKNLYERPGLSALREAVRVQDVDVVVAHALDRLSRNQNHLGLLFSECDYKDISIEFVTEKLEDTPEGRLLQAVSGFVAEVEREKIRERTQRGTRARAESGKLLVTNRPLYGYRWRNETKGALDVDLLASAVVKRLFHDASSGMSLRKIAQSLTNEGIPTPTGLERWRASTVHNILTRTAYIGHASAYHTSRLPGVQPLTLPKGTIPALVDEATFHAVQHRLALNKERSSRNNRHPNTTLLRGGIARCGYCGNALSTRQDPDQRGRSYFCSNTNRDRYGCPAFAMKAQVIDPAAWHIVERFLSDEEVVKAKLNDSSAFDKSQTELVQIDSRAKGVADKRQRLARILTTIDDDAAAEPIVDELKSLAWQAAVLEEQRRVLHASLDERAATERDVTTILEWRRLVAANASRLTTDERRQLLDVLGAVVYIRSASDEPRWELLLHPRPYQMDGSVVYTAAGG